MDYTKQRELDVGHFGAMWGCYGTGRINIPECERQRKATDSELDMILGRWFRLKLALMCNYKNDKTALTPVDPTGWGSEANPEWHYWILNRRAALLVAMEVLGVNDLGNEYEEHIMNVGDTNHYTIQVVGGELINPSPGLIGPVVEIRKVRV